MVQDGLILKILRISQGVRFENGGTKPSTLNADLRAEKVFNFAGLNIMAFAIVYNVFDIKNEYGVYGTTGRATVDLNVKDAGEVYGLNTIDDYIKNPGMYSTPREIRLRVWFWNLILSLEKIMIKKILLNVFLLSAVSRCCMHKLPLRHRGTGMMS
jgi:hypothetical protein